MKFINQATLDCSCSLLTELFASILTFCIYFYHSSHREPFSPKINLSLFTAKGKVWTYKALYVITPSDPPFSAFTFSFLFIPFQRIKCHQSHSQVIDFALTITSSCEPHNQLWMCTHAHTYTFHNCMACFLPSFRYLTLISSYQLYLLNSSALIQNTIIFFSCKQHTVICFPFVFSFSP